MPRSPQMSTMLTTVPVRGVGHPPQIFRCIVMLDDCSINHLNHPIVCRLISWRMTVVSYWWGKAASAKEEPIGIQYQETSVLHVVPLSKSRIIICVLYVTTIHPQRDLKALIATSHLAVLFTPSASILGNKNV